MVVLLNLITLLGYSLINCVIAGQILSAVSPNGSMSVVVGECLESSNLAMDLTDPGIIVVAIITWIVSTFGIKIFHHYMKYLSEIMTLSSIRLHHITDTLSSLH